MCFPKMSPPMNFFPACSARLLSKGDDAMNWTQTGVVMAILMSEAAVMGSQSARAAQASGGLMGKVDEFVRAEMQREIRS